MVLKPEERSTNVIRATDRAIQHLVDDLALIDLPLQKRKFTWSQAHTSFARLDRFLLSQAWNLAFPASTQKPLPNTASDHCPLLLTCETKFSIPNMFRFENYWI
jgi:endonuclease/exonuclease/phosphatase family metal-dependent hydrolase